MERDGSDPSGEDRVASRRRTAERVVFGPPCASVVTGASRRDRREACARERQLRRTAPREGAEGDLAGGVSRRARRMLQKDVSAISGRQRPGREAVSGGWASGIARLCPVTHLVIVLLRG